MKYGQIFHVMRIGKYYCKNMKYRIKLFISRVASYFYEPKASANTAYSHGLKMIFPGNFLSGVVYFPVVSPPAVFISLLFPLTTAAVVSSYYLMTKW